MDVNEKLVSHDFSSLLEKMRGIWCENLGVFEIANDDNYFVIGGDSIKGIKLFAKIRKVFDVELEYSDIFEYQELVSLSERVYEIRNQYFLMAR